MTLAEIDAERVCRPNTAVGRRRVAHANRRRRGEGAVDHRDVAGDQDGQVRSIASRLGCELLNVSVDACGGMAADTVLLVAAVGDEGEQCSMGTWLSSSIQRHLLNAIAVEVQKGNAMAMLTGYTRAVQAARDRHEEGQDVAGVAQ